MTFTGDTWRPTKRIGPRSYLRKVSKAPMAARGPRCYVAPMDFVLGKIILPIAVGAVAFVLLLGLINMMKGGSPNTSQKLMRLRVLLQFVAIVITMLAVWAMGR